MQRTLKNTSRCTCQQVKFLRQTPTFQIFFNDKKYDNMTKYIMKHYSSAVTESAQTHQTCL